ncbi:hypothetical protein [Actinomadura mexicana]|uniref:Uncharacterized protein n=1 Tax=Actinomadura mexicana TaxID=134959 RepID=A0A238VLD6_9ACTN|nr:hypothetical protein [Actinomadura mexicana]SNR35001.1 hypothetical protein SAMN06265355_1029 [Actinomadura mexicana]
MAATFSNREATRMDEQQRAYAMGRLAALKPKLDARGLVCALNGAQLTVSEVGAGPVLDTITCRPRVTDFGRWWYFDRGGNPINEADDVTGAALTIATNVRKRIGAAGGGRRG